MVPQSHYRLRQIARFALALLLFTQAALAVSGCLMPAADLAKIMAAVETSDCSETGSMNLNLCHAHCTADQQSLDTGEPTALPPLRMVVLLIPTLKYVDHPTFTVSRVEHPGDPPKPIRFCSFQI